MAAGPAATDARHLPWGPVADNRGRYASFFDDAAAARSSSSDAAAAAATAPASPDLHERSLDREQLRQLAPLLDRLGRTLTDAAPHVAVMAEVLPARAEAADGVGNEATTGTRRDPIRSLAARASHLYFGITNEDEDGEDDEEDSHDRCLTTTGMATSATLDAADEATAVDPDLTDYVNGMVNVSRGGNATWRGVGDQGRLIDSGERDPLGSSLLASYLSSTGSDSPSGGGGGRTVTAAEALGSGVTRNGNGGTTRVVRMGGSSGGLGLGSRVATGGGGPGIDIHIHAVVTGSGMANAGAGELSGLLMEAGGIGDTSAATVTASAADSAGDGAGSNGNNHRDPSIHRDAAAVSLYGNVHADNNQEDPDLFSELYSESPAPVNLHGGDNERAANVSEIDGVTSVDDLSHSFEECRSIEEDEDIDDNDRDDADKENEATAVSSASPSQETFTTGVATDVLPTTATDIGNNCNSRSSSSESLLALSEIESQESTATVPPPLFPSSTVDSDDHPTVTLATEALSLMQVGDSAASNTTRSPSFGNRIFRRTFGRLSSSSSRRSGNNGSSGGGGGSSSRST